MPISQVRLILISSFTFLNFKPWENTTSKWKCDMRENDETVCSAHFWNVPRRCGRFLTILFPLTSSCTKCLLKESRNANKLPLFLCPPLFDTFQQINNSPRLEFAVIKKVFVVFLDQENQVGVKFEKEWGRIWSKAIFGVRILIYVLDGKACEFQRI